MGRYFFILLLPLALLWIACEPIKQSNKPLFKNQAESSGINFSNNLKFTAELNPYTFRNFFNGGGVAIADINNDGLADIYFTGNQIGNKLYLNEGNLKFRDITSQAGVECSGVWSTGATFVDINADGWMDLYVCKSGPPGGENRHNQLFVNNGDLTFTDHSKEYGLDVTGLSVHAGFFDYDRDGDLDCYLLTNSIKSIGNFDLIPDQRKIPDPNQSGNKLFRNDNGSFKDVTAQSGIYHSAIGYGLGITFGDFNEDTWPDIFISNDFFERDYLYLNNQNGTFRESLTEYFPSISMGSMGADFADLDNDGIGELFVTEMLPENLKRRKTKTVFQTWNQFQLQEQAGYHRQFSRNVLQKKIGEHQYAEIGRLAGVAATEWSWSALMCDLNNDGLKDIFVANGIYKDLLDRDYLNYTSQDIDVNKMRQDPEKEITNLVNAMPVSSFSNYAFSNQGNFSFVNRSKQWGLNETSYSCGSAYGDLDNDGDLDLAVNNINSRAGLFINQTDTTLNRSITFKLIGLAGNPDALGASVSIWENGRQQVAEHFTTRGFQSSVQPGIRFGVGQAKWIDSVQVVWPNGQQTSLKKIKSNSFYTLNQKNTFPKNKSIKIKSNPLPFLMTMVHSGLFKHSGSQMNDFDRDRLLPWMYSTESPALTTGDINQDGSTEILVTGGKNQSSIFIDLKNSKPEKNSFTLKDQSMLSEKTACLFFDADGDGDQDLYIGTGGRSFSSSSSALQDQIWINDGAGNFSKSNFDLPFEHYPITSCVVPFDYDQDGDQDLFVGERFHPLRYGTGGGGHILTNLGNGKFENSTNQLSPPLVNVGMITDAVSTDLNNDGWTDIVFVGDWMNIMTLINEKGTGLKLQTFDESSQTKGWWNTIETADLNKDGKPDFVLGNHGLNTLFKSGDRMYVGDFDENGSVDQIFATKVGEYYFPIADRDELLSQIPSLKKTLLYYKDYVELNVNQLFPGKNLNYLEINELRSVLFLSEGEKFRKVPLPLQAQFAPVYAIQVTDLDGDGIADILAGGNLFNVKPEYGRFDGSAGWFLKGNLDKTSYTLSAGVSLGINGQIRDIAEVRLKGKTFILFAQHDDQLQIFEISH